MKKLMAVVVLMMMMVSMAMADGFYWNEYNMDAPVQYMVCGYDQEEEIAFTAIVDIVELERMAGSNSIFTAYAIDVDGVYEISWNWSDDGFIFYVIDCHGCEVEYIDFLPEIHQ